jgi:protein SCO1/2
LTAPHEASVIRSLAALAAAGALLTAAGCGRSGVGRGLEGHVPSRATNVSAIALPEVRPGQPERRFVFRAAPGHLLYVYFGYANCPDICPTTLSDLRRALRSLGADARRVDVAFVTVDPARDSAAVLAPYLASFVAGGHALRPSSQSELGLAEAAFGVKSEVVRRADGEVQVSHTSLAYVVDECGEILVQWDFGTPPPVIARDLARLLRARVAVVEPWAPSSPGGVTVGVAYLKLTSGVRDRLIGASVPDSVAARVEMHEVVTDRARRMWMRRVSAIELPPARPVAFEPGGRHLMLIGLARPLVAGDTLDLTLRFEGSAPVTARVPVRQR